MANVEARPLGAGLVLLTKTHTSYISDGVSRRQALGVSGTLAAVESFKTLGLRYHPERVEASR